MVFNAGSFSALLHALRLTQGSYKPEPVTFSSYAVDNNSTNFPGSTPSPSVHGTEGPPGGLTLFENVKEPSPVVQGHYNECFVEPYSAPPMENQVFPPFDPDMAHLYRYRQQQSVNLGSWYAIS
jgi:glucan 1,3-beta-glucosidase